MGISKQNSIIAFFQITDCPTSYQFIELITVEHVGHGSQVKLNHFNIDPFIMLLPSNSTPKILLCQAFYAFIIIIIYKLAFRLRRSLTPLILYSIILSMDIETIQEPLTAEEINFSRLVAKGYTGTKAYRMAFPHKAHLKHKTVYVNVSRLLSKSNIITEVATTKETTSRLARLAENRIEDILVNDSSSVKGSKVAEVAMFMYDHANGKATQRIQAQSAHVHVVYDLSGGADGEVPQEILDQLKDA